MKTTTGTTTIAAPARAPLKIRTALRAGLNDDVSALAVGALVVVTPRAGQR